MLKLFVIVLISGFSIYNGCAEVVITELSGTNNAEYGNTHALQCSYDYANETGVEIKWFYNGDNQIFLWIPNRTKPNAMEPWKSVLDSNVTTSDHDVTHSVIHFRELNFNLTGYYTCKVTGDEHEATKTEKMIVYRPASFVDISLESEENNTITISCSVFEVYPKPTINVTGLYLSEKNGTVNIYLINETISGDQDTLLNITKTFSFHKDELIAPTVELSCNVAIIDTNYTITRDLEYTSGYETTTSVNTEYYINDTTILPENETSAIQSSLDNSKKQGGIAAYVSAPYKWQLLLIIAFIYTKQWIV